VDDDRCPFLGEHARDRFADTAAAACDERASPRQLQIHADPLLNRALFALTASSPTAYPI
jgi:hypothetical protein